jgi:hypothetical protein
MLRFTVRSIMAERGTNESKQRGLINGEEFTHALINTIL